MSDTDIISIDIQIQDLFNKENVSEYIQKLEERKKCLSLNNPLKIKIDLEKEIKILKNKVNDIESKKKLKLYLMESSKILDRYREILSKPIKESFMNGGKKNKVKDEKIKLIDEYFNIVLKYFPNFQIPQKNTKYNSTESVVKCEICQKKDFDILDSRIYMCMNCGVHQEILGSASSYKDVSRLNVNSKFKYERRVHFKDCMNQYQGKQNSTIDEKVYSDLEEQFKLHNLLIDSEDKLIKYQKITKEHIHLFLKETDNSKYYEDHVLIYHRITGKKVDDISHLESKLMEDFDKLSNLYDAKYGHDKKLDRSSFLNSQYVLYQLLRRHKYLCNKDDFNILKTNERQSFHDEICQELFTELEWTFKPLF